MSALHIKWMNSIYVLQLSAISYAHIANDIFMLRSTFYIHMLFLFCVSCSDLLSWLQLTTTSMAFAVQISSI